MPEYYKQIPGWFNWEPLYGEVAADLPPCGIGVEVGVWLGRSIVYLAEKLNELGKQGCHLYAVDTWEGAPGSQVEEQVQAMRAKGRLPIAEFCSHIERAGVIDLVTPFPYPSTEAAAVFEADSVDALFLDGDHSYEGVRADLNAWIPKLRQGAILAGHDYAYPGVRQAVRDRFGGVEVCNGTWVVREWR